MKRIVSACLLGILFTTALHAQEPAYRARVDELASGMEDRVIAWRRDFHEHPELGNRETRTATVIAEHLRSLGMEVQTGVAKTGVVGILKGGAPGPVVALGADMAGSRVRVSRGVAFEARDRTA